MRILVSPKVRRYTSNLGDLSGRFARSGTENQSDFIAHYGRHLLYFCQVEVYIDFRGLGWHN